jgi:hypothetical protein
MLFVFSPSDNKELTIQGHLCIADFEFFILHELFSKSCIFWVVAECDACEFLTRFVKDVRSLIG